MEDPHQNGRELRRFEQPTVPPTVDPLAATAALSKDFPLDPETGTWACLFLPKSALERPGERLPVIFYYYGGGFVSDHANTKVNHDFCESLAAMAVVLVVSVDYRRAPEHRLPAAYDDAEDALMRIREINEEWIRRYADLSTCILTGSSAGGNIAYNVGLRVAPLDLDPLGIRGLVLHTPFIGGVGMTGSEKRLVNDPILPLAEADLMWKLALPYGADRDHEYCNPLAGGGSGRLDRVKESGWKVMVTGCTGDPLVDRQVEMVKMLEGKGVGVVAHFTEGGYRRIEVKDSTETPLFLLVVKDFIDSIHQSSRPCVG